MLRAKPFTSHNNPCLPPTQPLPSHTLTHQPRPLFALDNSPKILGGISGAGVLHLTSGQDLSIWAKSGILECNGLISTANVTFIWHVYEVSRHVCTTPSPPCKIYREDLVTAESSSSDHRQMLLRSNRLRAGARYRVSLRSLYTLDSTGRTRTDTGVAVYVSPGKVVALISRGMVEVNIHMEGGTRNLDASGSFDTADTSVARGSSAAAGKFSEGPNEACV